MSDHAAGTPHSANPPTSRLHFPVVGIGASAGGLAAIQQFLDHLPADSGMAFVVVLHLSPKYASNVDKVLQRHTRMPVQQAEGSMKIVPNHVYVIPPRSNLVMTDGYLEVQSASRVRGPHVAIDLFFRTLADVHRERAIGIVLSGTGSDGSQGLVRLKEQGGVTFAQSPADSEYEDMPRNAIELGQVDFVLRAADMPQQLVELWENARRMALPPPPTEEQIGFTHTDPRPEAEAELKEILQLLTARTGHDFSHYKRATVLRRIERRMQVRILKDVSAYRDYLRDNADETDALLDDMLINVTNFFRDRDAFEALERDVVPGLVGDLQSQPREDQIRVWVPGCATGEEAYSIAMLLSEETKRHALHLGANAKPVPFQVFATDIDELALAVARKGVYAESIVTDLTPTRLRDFFSRTESGYLVSKSLRARVTFAAQNALRDPPFSRLDLISCRNLLIYLSRGIQEQLLEMFHFALRPGGILFLGGSESVDTAAGLFEPIDKKNRIYRAIAAPGTIRRTPMMPLNIVTHSSPPAPRRQEKDTGFAFADVHQRVLEHYAPPSLIVSSDGNIVHMTERAAYFLQHSAGVPSLNMLELVHPALRAELRSAVLQATHSGKSVQSRTVRMTRGDGELQSAVNVDMYARPFTDPEAKSDFLLILFEESEQPLVDAPAAVTSSSEQDVMRQLERELQRTREQLLFTIESSDTAAEELRAINEELQAANEELRSASEELETSGEELQSVNEELLAANAELKNRAEDSARANDDLNNFIEATGIATVFVDRSLSIQRYTPRAKSVFNIIASDVGRSLLDLTHRLDYAELAADVTSVIGSGQLIEREISGMTSGRRFVVRLLPYLTDHTSQPQGAMLSFFDVTRLSVFAENQTDMRLALDRSTDFGVVLIGADGLISSLNDGARAIFGFTQREISGTHFRDLFTPEDRAEDIPELEMKTARQNGRAADERWHMRHDGSRVYCSGVLTPLFIDGKLEGYAKVVRDATQQRESSQREAARHRDALKTSMDLLSLAQAESSEAKMSSVMKDEFLAVMSHELKHPLNLINVNAEIIARAPDLNLKQSPTALRALGTITRAIRTQTRIVDDLLDLSRVRTGKLTLDLAAINLMEVAQLAIENVRADPAATALRFSLQSTAKTVLVTADAARLNQIVWNLLNNAIKFTPPDGQVSIRISRDDKCGRLDVVDSGSGISAEVLPQIFEMFGQADSRATSQQRGLGIGLALVRQLVEHQDGRIEAFSAGLGVGSRFSLWLPLHDAGKQGKQAVPREASSPQRCLGLSVLLVDDDVHTVDALGTLLRLEGANVTTATGGTEALQAMDQQAFDVVITDVGMPGMDGYGLLERIRARTGGKTLPVLALTGFGREKDVQRAAEAGFNAHISKPVAIDDLLQRLQRLLQRQGTTSDPAVKN